jgi:hypothetical protein
MPIQRLLFFLLVATTVWSAALGIEANRIQRSRKGCSVVPGCCRWTESFGIFS